MKKILTVAVLMLLLVCMTFILGSCGGVTVDQAKDDPAAIVSEALELSGAEFFSFDEKAEKIMAEALGSGAVTLSLKGNDALESVFGPGFSDAELKAIIYSNIKNNKYALELDCDVANKDIEGILFIDKEQVVLKSKTLLGSNNAYVFNPAAFAEKFGDSALAGMIPDAAGSDELTEILNTVKKSYAKLFEDNAEKAKEISRKFYEALDYEVTADKIDGISVIVVALQVNNETLEDVFEAFADAAELEGELKEEYLDEMEDALCSINEETKLNCQIKIAIEQNTKKLYNATVDCVASNPENDSQKVTLKADFAITDTKLVLDVDVEANVSEKLEYEFKLVGDKKVDGDKVEYDFALDVKGDFDGEEINGTVLAAAFDYDKKDGDFEFTIEGDEKIADVDVAIEGNVKVEANAVTVVIEEVGANSMSVKLGLGVKYEKGVAVPEAPEAKDIVELTEDELEELIEDIQQNSIFASPYIY